MLKEIKYAIYILTIFFSLFLIINFYLSDNNIKNNKKIILQYQNEKGESFKNLPVIENDTNNIIEYTNEIEKFKNKKKKEVLGFIKN